jgi:hypothetical protein
MRAGKFMMSLCILEAHLFLELVYLEDKCAREIVLAWSYPVHDSTLYLLDSLLVF